MENKNKIIIAVVAIVAVVAIIALLVAPKLKMSKMVGTYELVEMSRGSETYGKDRLDQMKSYGLTATMELKKDGTGFIELFGEKEDLKYDKKNITIDGDSASYTFKNKKVTIEKDGIKMVFEKK